MMENDRDFETALALMSEVLKAPANSSATPVADAMEHYTLKKKRDGGWEERTRQIIFEPYETESVRREEQASRPLADTFALLEMSMAPLEDLAHKAQLSRIRMFGYVVTACFLAFIIALAVAYFAIPKPS